MTSCAVEKRFALRVTPYDWGERSDARYQGYLLATHLLPGTRS